MPRPLTDTEVSAFRETLRDLATRLIADEGLHNLTLRRLATEADCSRQTPYRYFKNKDDLLEAVFVRCHEVFIEYCEEAVAGLLLNSVALEFILGIDELIFDALAPSHTKHVVANLLPVEVGPRARASGLSVGTRETRRTREIRETRQTRQARQTRLTRQTRQTL